MKKNRITEILLCLTKFVQLTDFYRYKCIKSQPKPQFCERNWLLQVRNC